MAALLIAVAAALVVAWRERTWRRAAETLRADRDRTRAELDGLSGLAHDLRSPLQGVIGNAELILASGHALATPAAEELQQIHDNASRAADIVRTIAAAAQTSTLSRRWQDLNLIVARALENCQPEFSASGIRVDFDRSERLPLVYVDGPQLESALSALMQHSAPRSTPRRQGAAATLRTRRREGGDDRLVVEFDDRTASVDTGTAADVASCRHIIEAHGGSLDVERPSKGGYRFVLELPVWTK
jgi:K+-sensing histidine kinase KdpD